MYKRQLHTARECEWKLNMMNALIALCVLLGCLNEQLVEVGGEVGYEPGQRSVLSAHNCYPYHGMWSERIGNAISTGYPISIEQDLCWVEDECGEWRSLVAQNGPFDGDEPSLDEHFFERVRVDVEASIEQAKANPEVRSDWPMVVLDLDFKNSAKEHIEFVYALLSRYSHWLTSVPKNTDIQVGEPLRVAPIMVLVGGIQVFQDVFYNDIEVGDPVIAFGRARTEGIDTAEMSDKERQVFQTQVPVEELLKQPANNFHRWWNNSWHMIEAGGPTRANSWDSKEQARLVELVNHAHSLGYFIRFYTINGHSDIDSVTGGYSNGYNTGSLTNAQVRWNAQINAGVDFIASDQYQLFHQYRESMHENRSSSTGADKER